MTTDDFCYVAPGVDRAAFLLVSIPHAVDALDVVLRLTEGWIEMSADGIRVLRCEAPRRAIDLLLAADEVHVVNMLQPGGVDETFVIHHNVERAKGS